MTRTNDSELIRLAKMGAAVLLFLLGTAPITAAILDSRYVTRASADVAFRTATDGENADIKIAVIEATLKETNLTVKRIDRRQLAECSRKYRNPKDCE